VVRVKSAGDPEPTIYINHPPKRDDEKARDRRFRGRMIGIWLLAVTPLAALLHIWTPARVAMLVPFVVGVALLARSRIGPKKP
jgi:hypothetical protein